MNQYFVAYPRNFSNEYVVLVAESAAIADAVRKHYPEADKITRKRAIYLGWSRPTEAGRTGEYWNGGFVSGPLQYDRRDSCLTDAAINTEHMVSEWELMDEQGKLYREAMETERREYEMEVEKEYRELMENTEL